MRNAEMQRRHKQLISSKEAASQARSVRQSKILEKVCSRLSTFRLSSFIWFETELAQGEQGSIACFHPYLTPPNTPQVHKEGERDPSRLLRPTSAHQRRVELNKADEHAPKDSGFILTTTHRAPAPLLYRAAAGG